MLYEKIFLNFLLRNAGTLSSQKKKNSKRYQPYIKDKINSPSILYGFVLSGHSIPFLAACINKLYLHYSLSIPSKS